MSERTLQQRGATFVRIFMATTGIIAAISGFYLLGVVIWRAMGYASPPRAVSLIFSIAFVVSFLLTGVCWILIALSDRLWKSTS